MTITLTMKLDVEDGSELELTKLEHHIDWLLDFDNWPEIVQAYDVHAAVIR